MHLTRSVFFAVCLLAEGSAFACPPPNGPPTSWDKQVKQAFHTSDVVALATVVREEKALGIYGEEVTRSHIRPTKFYKGSAAGLPQTLEKTTIDCDQRPILSVGETVLVFSLKGSDLLRATPRMDRFAEASGSTDQPYAHAKKYVEQRTSSGKR